MIEYTPLHVPIDPRVYVPLDYWVADTDFPPEEAGERYDRFSTYGDLARGDFDAILPIWLKSYQRDARPVQVNYFHWFADERRHFLINNPPEANVDIGDDLIKQVLDATSGVLYNYTIYGTGVFFAYRDSEGFPHLESVDPTNWFPSVDGDAYVVNGDGYYDVFIFTPDGGERRRFNNENLGSRLGDLIEVDTFSPLGGRPFFPCGNWPKQGEWGYSLIPELVPLVREHTELLSRISDVHQFHSSPFYVVEGSNSLDVDNIARAAEQRNANFLDDDDTFGSYQERQSLKFQHQRLRGWIEGIEGKIAAFPSLANTEDMRASAADKHALITALAAIPVTLQSSMDQASTSNVSGRTLEVGNAYPEAWIGSMQREVLYCLNRAARLLLGNEAIEFSWPNPFGEIGSQQAAVEDSQGQVVEDE